jgi:hypothetical protein
MIFTWLQLSLLLLVSPLNLNSTCAILERINNANKTYFMLQQFFKNKNISKKLKLRLKNIIIDKTLTDASETWTVRNLDREQVNVFEREVYR